MYVPTEGSMLKAVIQEAAALASLALFVMTMTSSHPIRVPA